MLDKELIKRNFSQSAVSYEKHAVLQKAMADSLISFIGRLSSIMTRILDIGCGTGYLTRGLAERFPRAEVIGIDIAPGMIEVAQKNSHRDNLSFVTGDGEQLLFPGHSFDLVVSNASLQWMEAERVFDGTQMVLRPSGYFLFNTFGPRTLQELRKSGFRVNEFLSAGEMERLLKEKFKVSWFVSSIAEQKFSSVKDLIVHLREIGAQASEINEKSRGDVLRALKEYKLRFGSKGQVAASFEIISGFCQLVL